MANVPQITSLPTAIRLYYERIELNNPQIRELFGNIGSARIASLKKAALNQMAEDSCSCWSAYGVNTQCAYKAWGLEIKDLEHRYEKLKKSGLLKEEQGC